MAEGKAMRQRTVSREERATAVKRGLILKQSQVHVTAGQRRTINKSAVSGRFVKRAG